MEKEYKVTHFDMCDTYLSKDEETCEVRTYSKIFKRKTIAYIYAFICRIFHDYTEIEEVEITRIKKGHEVIWTEEDFK